MKTTAEILLQIKHEILASHNEISERLRQIENDIHTLNLILMERNKK